MRNFIKKGFAIVLALTLILSLSCMTFALEEDTVNLTGNTITVSGVVENAPQGEIIYYFVLKPGYDLEDFYDPDQVSFMGEMIAQFGQTQVGQSGKYSFPFSLHEKNSSGSYTIILDSKSMHNPRSLNVIHYAAKDLEEAILALQEAQTAEAVDQELITHYEKLGLDLSDYNNFSWDVKKKFCETILNTDFETENIKDAIADLRLLWSREIGLYLINTTNDFAIFTSALSKYNYGMDLTLELYQDLGQYQENFFQDFKKGSYTNVEELRLAFTKQSVLTYVNFIKPVGRVKTMLEENGALIGLNFEPGSDYSKVNSTSLFDRVMKQAPFKTIEALKNTIITQINNLLNEAEQPKEDDGDKQIGGSTRPGGGSGGGGKFTVEVPNPQPTPTPTPIPSSESKFEDIKDHWAQRQIEELVQKGIVKGKTETQFQPDEGITRAETAALLARVLGLESGEKIFVDVTEQDWFYHSVNALAKVGIVSKDTNFRPGDLVTRQEMAKLFVEAYDYIGKQANEMNVEDFFDETQIAPWAISYVKKAVSLGLVQGFQENGIALFKPEETATRAQTVVMLIRLLGQ